MNRNLKIIKFFCEVKDSTNKMKMNDIVQIIGKFFLSLLIRHLGVLMCCLHFDKKIIDI